MAAGVHAVHCPSGPMTETWPTVSALDTVCFATSGYRQNTVETTTMSLSQYADDGMFSPRKFAETLLTTSEDIARTAGLGKDAVQRKDRIRSDKMQRRLREVAEIINKVEPRFGSALMAYAWYRSQPLPGFSGLTAMQLVRDGRADEVLDYIDAIDAGIHA